MSETTAFRFNLLDAVRGVGALIVVIYHCNMEVFIPWAWGLMDLFFVMSGVLITRTILINRSRGHTFGAFLVYRATRLMPILILTLIAYEVLVVVAGQFTHLEGRSSFDTLPYALLYYNTDLIFFGERVFPHIRELTHLWSLMMEEHFYFLWGLLLIVYPTMFKKITLPFLLGAGLLLIIPLLLRMDGMHWWVLPGRYDGFLVGCVLGLILFQPQTIEIHATVKKVFLVAFWVAVALSLVRLVESAIFSYQDHAAYLEHSTIWLDITCYAIVWAGAIVGILRLDQRGFSFGKVQSAMAWVGLVSYELYVVHYPMTFLIRKVVDEHATWGPLYMLIGTLGLSLPLSYALHRWVSAPALRSRRKIIAALNLQKDVAQQNATV